jgi:hypothetical protein
MTPVVELGPALGFQPTMFPVMEEKINAAGHDATAHGVTAKSVVALPTTPVGSPPGTVTKFSPGFSTSGEPETSPRNNDALLVPSLEIQKGLVPLKAIPHGLISNGSCVNAIPAMSDIKFVWR